MSDLRAALRDWVARALIGAGVTRPERVARSRLTIVTFHRVLPAARRAAYPLAGLAVTPELFEWLLRWLAAHYDCDTLAGAYGHFQEGPPARPLLALTFDDGQADNYHVAAPILARLGMRGTFFVPVGSVEEGTLLWHDRIAYAAARAAERDLEGLRATVASVLDLEVDPATRAWVAPLVGQAKALAPAARDALIEDLEQLAGGAVRPEWDGMMTWEQLAQLAGAGHEIGSHSIHHALLPQCTDAELEGEVAGSRRILEERLDRAVTSFCYPNGDHDVRCVDAVARAGYQQAVTTRWGLNRASDPPFTLRRCDLVQENSLDRRGRPAGARLAWRLSGLHPGLR
jgi:peptidoglycan/xylan/chitin deacetylase (PgdA/CDA1 family)